MDKQQRAAALQAAIKQTPWERDLAPWPMALAVDDWLTAIIQGIGAEYGVDMQVAHHHARGVYITAHDPDVPSRWGCIGYGEKFAKFINDNKVPWTSGAAEYGWSKSPLNEESGWAWFSYPPLRRACERYVDEARRTAPRISQLVTVVGDIRRTPTKLIMLTNPCRRSNGTIGYTSFVFGEGHSEVSLEWVLSGTLPLESFEPDDVASFIQRVQTNYDVRPGDPVELILVTREELDKNLNSEKSGD